MPKSRPVEAARRARRRRPSARPQARQDARSPSGSEYRRRARRVIGQNVDPLFQVARGYPWSPRPPGRQSHRQRSSSGTGIGEGPDVVDDVPALLVRQAVAKGRHGRALDPRGDPVEELAVGVPGRHVDTEVGGPGHEPEAGWPIAAPRVARPNTASCRDWPLGRSWPSLHRRCPAGLLERSRAMCQARQRPGQARYAATSWPDRGVHRQLSRLYARVSLPDIGQVAQDSAEGRHDVAHRVESDRLGSTRSRWRDGEQVGC